jgi:hypothetical protein
MSRRPSSGVVVPLALGALCAALAMIVQRQTQLAAEAVPEPEAFVEPAAAAPEDVPVLAEEPALEVPSHDTFLEIVERPIFSQSRRPAAEAEVPVVQAPPPTLDYELAGVVIWETQRIALVRPLKGTEITQVAVGGALSGWDVVAIEPERVLLHSGKLEQEMRLKYREPRSEQ